MNLDTIPEWVTYEESLPWCRSSIVSLYACGLQLGSQSIHVGALNAEVPLRIRSKPRLFY